MGFDNISSTKKPESAGYSDVFDGFDKKKEGFDLEELKKKWLSDNIINEKLVCLIMAPDGSGKSGIALDYMTDADIKDGKRALIIDLDGGCDSILLSHHKKRCEKHGRKLSDVFLLRNPLEENINGEIDYKVTFDNIREGIFLAKKAWKELNLKFIVFDGLSTALKHAEQQMRLEKNISDDGGVNLRYWLVRNKIFTELLEQIKSLPISSFFIAHEDFILKDSEDNSSVKIKTNALCHQKVHCKRIDDKINKQVKFVATITKSKFKASSEGAVTEFLTVNKEDKTFKWSTKELYDLLM